MGTVKMESALRVIREKVIAALDTLSVAPTTESNVSITLAKDLRASLKDAKGLIDTYLSE